MLFANMSRLSLRARIPLAAELVSGSIRYVVLREFNAIRWPCGEPSHTEAKSRDEFVVERIRRDKKVPERDSRQFFIAVKLDNHMRISAAVTARHMP
jgi:hypothetical protein